LLKKNNRHGTKLQSSLAASITVLITHDVCYFIHFKNQINNYYLNDIE